MRSKHLLVTLAILGAAFAGAEPLTFAQPAAVAHGPQTEEERDRLLSLVVLLGAPLLPQEQAPVAPEGKKPAAVAQASQQHENQGERIFQQNCGRCHNAPEGFSPRISGTIVRHMRVRASLSRKDEEELLRFFNP